MDQPTTQVADPLGWGYSLANVFELLSSLLEAAAAKTVLEVGAFEGDLTRDLLAWADKNGASISTVEPLPPARLQELMKERPELTVIEDIGVGALSGLDSLPDAIIIDGDHNYFTLTQELDAIGDSAGAGQLPLLMFHDAGWPHARRDTYYAPERVPEEFRQPLAEDVGVTPGEPGTSPDRGLPYKWAAAREGGPGNGVLTALEDFVAKHENVKLAVVPAFFGFAVIYDDRSSWAGQAAALLAPWDRHPILERLESNRVDHLIARHDLQQEVHVLRERIHEQEVLLRNMLESSAFGLAEKASRLKQRGEPIFSRKRIEEVLGD